MEQFAAVWQSLQPSWTWGTKSNEAKVDGFRLPISHRIEENLDRDNLEQASLDKNIPNTNVGYRLLRKMGWREGHGLGRSQQGIVDPVRTNMNEFRLGLGKQEQDDFYTNEENIQRKKLEVEIEETEELAQKREAEAQRQERIQTEVKEIQKVFYCELCNKQYKLASEMEVHLSSYDHNHKKRFKESMRGLNDEEKLERQRREKLREEKELQKRAQLLSAQRPAATVSSTPESTTAAPSPAAASAGADAAQQAPSTVQVQRPSALKFGFSGKAKPGGTRRATSLAKGKPKADTVASIFGDVDEEDEENTG